MWYTWCTVVGLIPGLDTGYDDTQVVWKPVKVFDTYIEKCWLGTFLCAGQWAHRTQV
jgi:hypothetical protein